MGNFPIQIVHETFLTTLLSPRRLSGVNDDSDSNATTAHALYPVPNEAAPGNCMHHHRIPTSKNG